MECTGAIGVGEGRGGYSDAGGGCGGSEVGGSVWDSVVLTLALGGLVLVVCVTLTSGGLLILVCMDGRVGGGMTTGGRVGGASIFGGSG